MKWGAYLISILNIRYILCMLVNYSALAKINNNSAIIVYIIIERYRYFINSLLFYICR